MYYAPQPQYSPSFSDDNDFEITAEELAGIEYVPSSVRMQSSAQPSGSGRKSVNFKTIAAKGLLWALLGSLLGFVFSEMVGGNKQYGLAASIAGYPDIGVYLSYKEKADEEFNVVYEEFLDYCSRNNINPDSENEITKWYQYHASAASKQAYENYSSYDEKASDALFSVYEKCDYSEAKTAAVMKKTMRISYVAAISAFQRRARFYGW